MDLREKFINDILLSEQQLLNNGQLKELEMNLRLACHNIRFEEECTELSTKTDDNDYILKVFVAHKRIENLSDQTIRTYIDAMKRMLIFLDKNYKDVSSNDVKYYLAYYKEIRKVKAATLTSVKRNLSAFYGWAYDEGLVSKNIVKAVKGIRPDPVKKIFLTDHEKEMLRDSCIDKRELALIDFLLSTGVRVGELETIELSDVDFQKGTVSILGHKGRRYRKVYLSAKASKHLQDYIGSRNDSNAGLFVGQRTPNNPLRKCTYEFILKEIAKRAGISKKCTVHIFRKTLATTLHKNGCNIEYIAEILGHKSTQTTEQCYLSLIESDVQNAFMKYSA